MSVSQVNFCFEVPNISQLESAWSPVVFVHEVPWKIHVGKCVDGEKQSIGVYLLCEREDASTNWSYAASAAFKLFSFNDNVKAVKYVAEPFVFDNKDRLGFGTSSFIEWNDLFENHYVKNDAMELYITIQVSDPNLRDKSALTFEKKYSSCADDCFAKFSLNITNVRNLMAVKSPELKIQNLPWKLLVHKHENHLGVRLTVNTRELPTHMVSVKLFSTKGDEKFAVQGFQVVTEKFIAWDELFQPENGFIDNNSIKLEVTIVSNSNFQNAKNFLQSMTPCISVPRFCIEIPNISKLERIMSPEVTIRGVSWAVSVRKRHVNSKLSLVAYLHCIKTGEYRKVSYAASFSIKLLSFNESVEAIECQNVPNVFDNDVGYGDPLIVWDDLFEANKCFVKDDTIILDISIDVADLNVSKKSELLFKRISNDWEEGYRKFHLNIKNIESLVALKSPQFTMKNLPWNLLVFKHQSHLGVGLLNYGNESCTRTMVVKLLSMKAIEKSVEQVQSKNFEAYDEMYTNKLISWNELLKSENGFVNNTTIVMEVTIAANIEDAQDLHRPTAPEAEKPKTDCPICLENMKEKSVSCIPCGHLFCSPCITNIIKDSPVCPLCRSSAKLNEIRRIYMPF